MSKDESKRMAGNNGAVKKTPVIKKKKIGKSIVFVKFKASLEVEIRLFWHILASQEYSQRWLLNLTPAPVRLSNFPGDDKNPFKSIDLTPSDFLSHASVVRASVRENALVSFITAFEFYLFETLQRLIYIDPELINDSALSIEAKELSSVDPAQFRQWLATKVADKYLRNKTHSEMIVKIDKFAKAGISNSLQLEISEWNKWSLVRNAIVHTSRFVTSDLMRAWPERFRSVGESLNLTDKEVARVHHLALTISSAIDKRAVESIVKKNDARLLAREIFVQQGKDDPRQIRLILNHVLQTPIPVVEIQKILSDQRRGIFDGGWALSHGDLMKILG